MKAVLEFTRPDDEVVHRNAVDAGKAFRFINWMNTELRNKIKYDNPKDLEFLEDLYRAIYDEFPNIDER